MELKNDIINNLILDTKSNKLKWHYTRNDSTVIFSSYNYITKKKYIRYKIINEFNYGFYDKVLVITLYNRKLTTHKIITRIHARKHKNVYELITLIKNILQ